MAPARSSRTALADAHQRCLAESHSIIEEFRRRDALLQQGSPRKKITSAKSTVRRTTKATGTRSDAMSTGRVRVLEDIPAAPVAKAFATLPAEMNQEIAKYLCDKDLASFALVQHETLYAVVPANAGHWPVRFREQFDLRKNSKFSYRSPISIMEDYKMRKCFFTPKVFFTLGNKDAQRSCLMVIRRMINEAFSHCPDSSSNNYLQLARFMMKSNLLFDALRWISREHREKAGGNIEHIVNPLLMTVHVFFFSYYLKYTPNDTLIGAYPLALRQTVYQIKWSQDVLLAPPELPLVNKDGAVDMGLLYHLTNFWRFHLVLNDDADLYGIFLRLKPQYKPCAPTRKLEDNSLLFNRAWMGAMFHPAGHRMRSFDWSGYKNEDVYTNGYFTGGDEPLEIHVDWTARDLTWPEAFENHVNAIPDRANDLPYVLNHEHKIRAVSEFMKKRSRRGRRTRIPVARSAEDTYKNSLPFRRMAQEDDFAKIVRKTKPSMKYRVFIGTCDVDCGDDALNIAGVLHPLPPQSGIHEWQRVTMVSYETPASGTAAKGYLDAAEDDLQIYMQFEGVVCPGANMMLGRYHIGKAYDDDYDEDQLKKRGPFIFWTTAAMQKDDYDDATDGSTSEDIEHSSDSDPGNASAELDEENEDDWCWDAAMKAHQELWGEA